MQQGLPSQQPLVARFVHETGNVRFRVQVPLIVRDGDGRIACLRLENAPDQWMLPVENLILNEDPAEAAARVAKTWFTTPLKPRFRGFLNYPDDGDHKWYLLIAFEADAPAAGLEGTADTLEIRFVEPGKPPGPFAMSHEDVFRRITS